MKQAVPWWFFFPDVTFHYLMWLLRIAAVPWGWCDFPAWCDLSTVLVYTHMHMIHSKSFTSLKRVQSLTNEEAWINEKVLGQSWFENCTLKLQKLWATSVKTVWRCRAAYCQAKAQNFCFLADCRFFFWMFKWDPPQVNTTAVSDACLIFEARARMFVTALYCWSCVTAHLYVYWNTKVQFQSAKSSLDAFHIFP